MSLKLMHQSPCHVQSVARTYQYKRIIMGKFELIKFYKKLLKQGVIKVGSAGHTRLKQLELRRWISDQRT